MSPAEKEEELRKHFDEAMRVRDEAYGKKGRRKYKLTRVYDDDIRVRTALLCFHLPRSRPLTVGTLYA
jgi:hypothetical protein